MPDETTCPKCGKPIGDCDCAVSDDWSPEAREAAAKARKSRSGATHTDPKTGEKFYLTPSGARRTIRGGHDPRKEPSMSEQMREKDEQPERKDETGDSVVDATPSSVSIASINAANRKHWEQGN